MITAGTIISALRTIAGAFIPALKRRYFDQPKVYLSIEQAGGISKLNLGLSIHNEQKSQFVNGKELPYIDGNTALRIFQINRNYRLTLRNNSEHVAYHIKLLKPLLTHDCTISPKLNYLNPLIENDSAVFTLTFTSLHEVTGEQSVAIYNSDFTYFKEHKVVLEYTNVKGTKFYTELDLKRPEEERNSFHRKNPLYVLIGSS